MSDATHLVVLCTCPSADVGAELAGMLVGEQLAACANLVPGLRSIYRWQGEICDDAEVLLVIKTTSDRFEGLRARLADAHPYDCPEIIGLPVTAGHQPYLDWMVQQTRGS